MFLKWLNIWKNEKTCAGICYIWILSILIRTCVTFQQSQEALIFMYLLDALMAGEVTGWCSDSSDRLSTESQYNEVLASTWLSCDNLADCYQAGVSPSLITKTNVLLKSTTHSPYTLLFDLLLFHLISSISPGLDAVCFKDEQKMFSDVSRLITLFIFYELNWLRNCQLFSHWQTK